MSSTPPKFNLEPTIPLGTEVDPFGKIAAVLYSGERYYHLIDRYGNVTMMPAFVIEPRFKHLAAGQREAASTAAQGDK